MKRIRIGIVQVNVVKVYEKIKEGKIEIRMVEDNVKIRII